jgi:hypothetical protein
MDGYDDVENDNDDGEKSDGTPFISFYFLIWNCAIMKMRVK